MPELPEVETTRKGISPKLQNQTITQIEIRQTQLRWPVETRLKKILPGLKVTNITRRGKYLLLQTPKGHLIIHLGMSGNLRILPKDTPVQKHDHIDLILENGFCLRYHDPRRFGAWLWFEGEIQAHPLLSKLGPEPLEDNFNGDTLFKKTRNRKVAIKTLIMNSHIVVGVGNIYANESLFLSQISPLLKAKDLTLPQAHLLAQNIKQVLQKSIEQGGTTLKDFLTPEGKPGYFEQSLQVYGRANQPCPVCQTPIQKIDITQRASYFCPNCQPNP